MTELSFNFNTLQYILCPFAGSVLALIFYEFIYVKTQELLNEDDMSSNDANDSGLGQLGHLEGEIEPGQTSGDDKNDNDN